MLIGNEPDSVECIDAIDLTQSNEARLVIDSTAAAIRQPLFGEEVEDPAIEAGSGHFAKRL